METVTVAKVNKALRQRGVDDVTLRRGHGYYYFSGEGTWGWYETAVYVYRVENYTLAAWMSEFDRLNMNPANY